MLNIPTIPEYRMASRIEGGKATPDHESVKTGVPKTKSTKSSKWNNQLIIHYTHEQRLQNYKRDLHRLWNETYRSTPIIHTRLIVARTQARINDQSFALSLDRANNSYVGVIGISPLASLISIPKQSNMDYFHLTLEVHLVRLLKNWKLHLTNQEITLIDNYLCSITYPHTFRRMPFLFSRFHEWKASQLRTFLIYDVMPLLFVFMKIFPGDRAVHFSLFFLIYIRTLRFICNRNDIEPMKHFIIAYLKDIHYFYGDCAQLYSTHALYNLYEQVLDHGSLSFHSMIGIESALHHLDKLASGTTALGSQIAYWHSIYADLSSKTTTYTRQLFENQGPVNDHNYIDENLVQIPQTVRRSATKSSISIVAGAPRYGTQQSANNKVLSQATTDENISYRYRNVSSQQRELNASRKSIETHTNPQSPSIKRRFHETDLADSLAEIREQMQALRQSNDALHTKLDDAREAIRLLNDQQQKSNKKLNQISHIKNNNFQGYDTPKRFPIIEFNGKNLMIHHQPPNQPALFMCKLIRDLYTDDEIEAGIADDDLLDAIKNAVEAAYFHAEPKQFEFWWWDEGKKSRAGQRRKQRSTNKKKPHVHQQIFGNHESNDKETNSQTTQDDIAPLSSSETHVSLIITDRECTRQSELVEVSSPISSEQVEFTIPSATATQIALIPGDISRSGKERPAQPKLVFYKKNKDNRSFQPQWFSMFTWIEYSTERNSVFCFYCRHFVSGNLNSRNQSDSFVTCGYDNWKLALVKERGFSKHASTATHIQASANYQEYVARSEHQMAVTNVLDHGRILQIQKNRERLMKIASTLHFCSRQMIAFCGHEENELNCGNFIELLKLMSSRDPVVQSILENSSGNATYLSATIQNELIHEMANQVREQISKKLRGCVFALMADETRDISGHEQLSIVVWVVSSERVPGGTGFSSKHTITFNEYLVGLVKLDAFHAQTLADEIVQYFSSLNISLNKASVMSGKHAGVQAILRQNFAPGAIYIHCYAHQLNLVICDVSQVVLYLPEFYCVLSKIHSYFSHSSVTNEWFKCVQKELKLDNAHSISLKAWAETRWDSRWSSIDSIQRNYGTLLVCFQELEAEATKRSVDARGLLRAMKKPTFVVTLFILHKVLGIIKILSDQLKAKSMDYGRAKYLIRKVISQLSDLRTEQSFSTIYEQVSNYCIANNIDLTPDPKEKRARNIPVRFKDVFITSTVGHRDLQKSEDDYRTTLYYPIIDSTLLKLNDRFFDDNILILNGISALCPESDSFLHLESIHPLATQMNVDFPTLCNEIQVLKPMLKDKTMNNIVDLYTEILPLKSAFSQLTTLLLAAVTIPISSKTCERTFSKMKLIKTKTRNSVKRLTDLIILRYFDYKTLLMKPTKSQLVEMERLDKLYKEIQLRFAQDF
ncbi:unnamed protein product [Adineta ricciae]|nr:unnamed protein product [Adineta ricciae]